MGKQMTYAASITWYDVPADRGNDCTYDQDCDSYEDAVKFIEECAMGRTAASAWINSEREAIERVEFDKWCASVKDRGHEVQPNSATARQRKLGWDAAMDYLGMPRDRLDMVRPASAPKCPHCNSTWHGCTKGRRLCLSVAGTPGEAPSAIPSVPDKCKDPNCYGCDKCEIPNMGDASKTMGAAIGTTVAPVPLPSPATPDGLDDLTALEALTYLVSLKAHKDQFGKTAYYESRQPHAWERAIKALGNESLKKPPSLSVAARAILTESQTNWARYMYEYEATALAKAAFTAVGIKWKED